MGEQSEAAQPKTLLASSGSGGKSPRQKDAVLDADVAPSPESPVPVEAPGAAVPPEAPAPAAGLPATEDTGAATGVREEGVVVSTEVAHAERVRPLTERDGVHRPDTACNRKRKRKGTPWPGKGGNPLSPVPPDESDIRWWHSMLPHWCTSCHEVEEDAD